MDEVTNCEIGRIWFRNEATETECHFNCQYFVTVGQRDNIQKENSHAGLLLRKTESNHNWRQIYEQRANEASDFETALDGSLVPEQL